MERLEDLRALRLRNPLALVLDRDLDEAAFAVRARLKQERVDELLKDEKTMTRVLADRIIKTEVLGKAGTKQFALALDEAGYPASLTSGADPVLNTRTKKMLNAIDIEKIVKAAGL